MLSRSPLVNEMAIALHENVRSGRVKLGDVVEIRAADEAATERKQVEALRRFTRLQKLNRDLVALHRS